MGVLNRRRLYPNTYQTNCLEEYFDKMNKVREEINGWVESTFQQSELGGVTYSLLCDRVVELRHRGYFPATPASLIYGTISVLSREWRAHVHQNKPRPFFRYDVKKMDMYFTRFVQWSVSSITVTDALGEMDWTGVGLQSDDEIDGGVILCRDHALAWWALVRIVGDEWERRIV